jgi:AbrB family looped-hinge helix DNA binding protein
MSTATLSTKGQLVIPTRFRKALSLQPGDELQLTLQGPRLVLERTSSRRARLAPGKFGRPVLVAPAGAPRMTTASVNAILDDIS